MKDKNSSKEKLMHEALNTPFASLKEALVWTLDSDDSKIHYAVLHRRDIKSYIYQMKAPELLDLAKDIDTHPFYDVVLKQHHVKKYLLSLKMKNLIKIFCSLEILIYNKNYNLILAKIFEYLTLENIDEALILAEKIDHWKIWDIVLKRVDLSCKEALFYARKINSLYVWGSVLSREDVNMNICIYYLKKLSDVDLTGEVLYLSKIPLEVAFDFVEKYFSNEEDKKVIYNHYIFNRHGLEVFFFTVTHQNTKKEKYQKIMKMYEERCKEYREIIEKQDAIILDFSLN